MRDTGLDADGYKLIYKAVDEATVDALNVACKAAFEAENEFARSSLGHVYAARNLLNCVPLVRTFWQFGVLREFLQAELGERFGLVRVLFFDKPPDRTWALPWHKDTAIAVKNNSLPSRSFSRPTVKAGVPHVIAGDDVLARMLTLRIHLDQVTDENGPLRVIPGSHASSSSEGEGADKAVTIYAAPGDVLAMRPLITHCSGASLPNTTLHRRLLHLEFAADATLADHFEWHDFVQAEQSKQSF